MPIGVQLIGRRNGDRQLLQAAIELEKTLGQLPEPQGKE
jgi:Asp-tRNA(Asn)/Glu-tRNA(Gln) amidotransferase A subunit family amidase